MEEEEFYNNIQKAFENLPENFSIMEEQIDIEVQMKYFEYARKIRKDGKNEEAFIKKDELFDSAVDSERKKEILTGLAGVDDVKAFRTIERYLSNAEPEIEDWATIAYQESKMLMHSSLLDEQQFFISTGLGGKDKKLRYFVVFIGQNQDNILTDTQRKLLKNELIYMLKGHDGQFESIDFIEGFATALIMLPISADLKKIVNDVVEECNQYGGFLQEDVIITNVKVLSRGEIIQMLEGKTKPKPNPENLNFDELDTE